MAFNEFKVQVDQHWSKIISQSSISLKYTFIGAAKHRLVGGWNVLVRVGLLGNPKSF